MGVVQSMGTWLVERGSASAGWEMSRAKAVKRRRILREALLRVAVSRQLFVDQIGSVVRQAGPARYQISAARIPGVTAQQNAILQAGANRNIMTTVPAGICLL